MYGSIQTWLRPVRSAASWTTQTTFELLRSKDGARTRTVRGGDWRRQGKAVKRNSIGMASGAQVVPDKKKANCGSPFLARYPLAPARYS